MTCIRTRKSILYLLFYGFGNVFHKKLDKTTPLNSLTDDLPLCKPPLLLSEWSTNQPIRAPGADQGCSDWLISHPVYCAPGTNTGPDIGPGHNIVLSLCSN